MSKQHSPSANGGTRVWQSSALWRFLGARRGRIWTLCAFAIALLVSAVVYGCSLDNHFVSDDWVSLYAMSNVDNLSDALEYVTFNTNWFVRPTQWLLTWGLYKAFGLSPFPYHLTSVGLDMANALLLGVLTYELLGISCKRLRVNVVLALLVSTLFVLSWRHHEAIFWYSSISELLQAFFRFVSLLLVLYWFRITGKKRWAIYTLSVGGYALAIFSKESAVILPVEMMLLLAYVTASRQGPWRLRRLTILVPFVLVTAVWGGFYVATSVRNTSAVIERGGLQLLHASVSDWIFRVLQFFNGNYIGTRFLSRSTFLMTLELFGLSVLVTAAFIRKRYLWLLALAWTVIAIAPYVATTSNEAVRLQLPVLLLGVGGDRFLYYSAAGASLFLVMSARWFVDELRALTASRYVKLASALVALLFVLLLGLNAVRLIKFEGDWDAAGDIGAEIVNQVRTLVPSPEENSVLCLANLPDSYNGKYVFRNGMPANLYLVYQRDDFGVRATVQPSTAFTSQPRLDERGCSSVLWWNEATARLVQK